MIQRHANVTNVNENVAIIITNKNSILRYLIRYLFQFNQWNWCEEEQLSI